MSEFSFYSFCGGLETSAERKRRPTFQEWLDQMHGDLNISVIEHPTYDFKSVPSNTLDAIKGRRSGTCTRRQVFRYSRFGWADPH